MTNYGSARTIGLYESSQRQVSLDEVERFPILGIELHKKRPQKEGAEKPNQVERR
jgi:hypothetical protein